MVTLCNDRTDEVGVIQASFLPPGDVYRNVLAASGRRRNKHVPMSPLVDFFASSLALVLRAPCRCVRYTRSQVIGSFRARVDAPNKASAPPLALWISYSFGRKKQCRHQLALVYPAHGTANFVSLASCLSPADPTFQRCYRRDDSFVGAKPNCQRTSLATSFFLSLFRHTKLPKMRKLCRLRW